LKSSDSTRWCASLNFGAVLELQLGDDQRARVGRGRGGVVGRDELPLLVEAVGFVEGRDDPETVVEE